MAGQAPNPTRSDLKSVFNLFFHPGEVTEIRSFGHKGNNSAWEGFATGTVLSGYFDNAIDFGKAAMALDEAGATGVYFIPNPVNSALLARAHNRLKVAKETTKDSDIVCLRWLLVDADPSRPSGISATDEEVARANALIVKIDERFEKEALPAGIYGCSGNGYHAMYLLPDLPNDEPSRSIIKKTLQALSASFSTDQVKIDEKVFNPARIWKLYGTMARKGDSTPDRPHRRSFLCDPPNARSEMTSVSMEQLRWLADQAPGTGHEKEKTYTEEKGGGLNVARYLERYGVPFHIKEHDVGTMYLLDACPFEDHHTCDTKWGDSGIIKQPDGKLLFQCFHDHCSDRTWADVRKKISGNDSLAPFMMNSDREKTAARQSTGKPDPSDPSIFVSLTSLMDDDEPNRPDLWEGEIKQEFLVGISGKWGAMKSLLMQAMALRAAQGEPFLGRRLAEIEVFYFDLENPRAVWKKRMLDLAGTGRPERFHPMTIFGSYQPPVFDTDGIAFYNKLAELHPRSLFVFDSLVRFYPSGKQSENTEDAVYAMTVLRNLTRWGVTVIYLHHPTKDGGDFRGGGDLQAAPDLLYTLTHSKKDKRLILECTKNRLEEPHTLQIGYETLQDGRFAFIDLSSAEETRRRGENEGRVAALLEIIKDLYAKGESNKTKLLEEGNKRLHLGRRILEPIIDNGVGVTWTCSKVGTRYVYAPLCTGAMYTNVQEGNGNAENACNDGQKHRVHDEGTPSVHDERNLSCSCTSCTHPIRVYTSTQGAYLGDAQTNNSAAQRKSMSLTDDDEDAYDARYARKDARQRELLKEARERSARRPLARRPTAS